MLHLSDHLAYSTLYTGFWKHLIKKNGCGIEPQQSLPFLKSKLWMYMHSLSFRGTMSYFGLGEPFHVLQIFKVVSTFCLSALEELGTIKVLGNIFWGLLLAPPSA